MLEFSVRSVESCLRCKWLGSSAQGLQKAYAGLFPDSRGGQLSDLCIVTVNV